MSSLSLSLTSPPTTHPPISSANRSAAQENGVETAIQCIYRDLEYATNLIKAKAGKNQSRRDAATSAAGNSAGNNNHDGSGESDLLDDDDGDGEESWTFVVGDPGDADAADEGVLKSPAISGPAAGRRGLGGRVLGGAVGTGLGLVG
jgi:sterol 3beta-glucosyltransferase